jgi:hypothetical protein
MTCTLGSKKSSQPAMNLHDSSADTDDDPEKQLMMQVVFSSHPRHLRLFFL